jgi:hypothetical protein
MLLRATYYLAIAYYLKTYYGESSTFYEVIKSIYVSMWMIAMQEEIKTLHKNNI